MNTSVVRVRVFHDVAKGPKVDVYVDESRVLSEVPYKGKSDYLEIPSGIHTVDVKASPSTLDSPSLITQNVNLAARGMRGKTTSYTVVAHGDVSDLSSLSVLLIQDRCRCPKPHQSGIRFVHSAATVPAVDVYLGGKKALSNRAYGSTTDYLEIPSGQADIKVKVAGTTKPVIAGTLFFDQGVNYTIYATGLVGDQEAPLGIEMFTDANGICYVMQ